MCIIIIQFLRIMNNTFVTSLMKIVDLINVSEHLDKLVTISELYCFESEIFKNKWALWPSFLGPAAVIYFDTRNSKHVENGSSVHFNFKKYIIGNKSLKNKCYLFAERFTEMHASSSFYPFLNPTFIVRIFY
jgi:hypothetical protein